MSLTVLKRIASNFDPDTHIDQVNEELWTHVKNLQSTGRESRIPGITNPENPALVKFVTYKCSFFKRLHNFN